MEQLGFDFPPSPEDQEFIDGYRIAWRQCRPNQTPVFDDILRVLRLYRTGQLDGEGNLISPINLTAP